MMALPTFRESFRMIRPRPLLAAASLAAALLRPDAAHATATLTCDVEEKGFVVHLQAAVGHEELSLSGFQGELRLAREGVSLALDGETPMQAWIEGEDLRLRLHVDAENGRPDVGLVILTRRTGETAYAGRYRLTLDDGEMKKIRRGAVVCGLG